MLLWPPFFGGAFFISVCENKLKTKNPAAQAGMFNLEPWKPALRQRRANKIQIVQSSGLCNRAVNSAGTRFWAQSF